MRALDLCGLKFSTYGSLFNTRKPKLGTSTDCVRHLKSSVKRLQDFAFPGRHLTLRSRLGNMSCQKFFSPIWIWGTGICLWPDFQIVAYVKKKQKKYYLLLLAMQKDSLQIVAKADKLQYIHIAYLKYVCIHIDSIH